MKDDEFRRRIEQLAEIQDRKVARVNIRSKKQEEEGPVFPDGENPTLGFDIVRLKNQTRICELGCNQIVDGQVLEYRFNHFPVEHWRTKCLVCQKYQHPSGEGMIEDHAHIQNEFVKHFKMAVHSKPRG